MVITIYFGSLSMLVRLCLKKSNITSNGMIPFISTGTLRKVSPDIRRCQQSSWVEHQGPLHALRLLISPPFPDCNIQDSGDARTIPCGGS